MKTRIQGLILTLYLAAAISGTARATTILITLDGNWADYHQYSYTDTDGNPHSGIPSGPYLATLSGGTFVSAAAQVFCYDFNVDTYIGQTYSGILVIPTTQADIEAAYLENLVQQEGGYNADIESQSGPISMAIWYLENPSSVNPTPFAVDQTTAALVAQAQNAILNGSWTAAMADNYPIWIPDTPGSSQRFGIMLGPQFGPGDVDPPAPEPGTVWLLGGGGLLLILSRKLRSVRN